MNASTIYLAIFLYFIVGSTIARHAGRKLGREVNDFFWPAGLLAASWLL